MASQLLIAPRSLPGQDQLPSPHENQCRICLEMDTLSELIAPCQCSGTCRWVHRRCLDRWRVDGQNSRAFTHCPNCGFAYLLVLHRSPTETDSEMARRRRRFIGRQISHFLLTMLLVQCVLVLLAMLIRFCDQQRQLVKLYHFSNSVDNSDKGSFADAFWGHQTTYYISAIILALFLIGLGCLLLLCWRACCRGHCLAGQPDPYCYGACDNICLSCQACECSAFEAPSCGGCRGSCGCADSEACGGEACAVICIVLFLAIVFVGVIILAVGIVVWIQRTIQKSAQLQELRNLTSEYLVEDLSDLPPPREEMSFRSRHEMSFRSFGQGMASAPSAPPATFPVSFAPMTALATQQSLTMDLQAIYGIQTQ